MSRKIIKEGLKKAIKPLVKEEIRRILKEGKDYAKLQELIWVDGSSGRGDEEDMEALNRMYDNDDYKGMIDYLAQWDYGDAENGGEIYDGLQEYDRVLAEDDRYILVTVEPRYYWGDRPFGLYIKISPEEAEEYGY